MECPPGCPGRVYALMRECWHWEAANRPTFRQMHHDMENMFQVRGSLQEVISTNHSNLYQVMQQQTQSLVSGGGRQPAVPAVPAAPAVHTAVVRFVLLTLTSDQD